MKRRTMSFLVAICIIIALLPITSPNASAVGGYNAAAAAQYAMNWYNSFNPQWYNWESEGYGDCANFVSQCLYAGGLQMSNGWYWNSRTNWNYSGSWTIPQDQRNYLVNILGCQIINYPSAGQIAVGDVLMYDWDNDGRWDHSAICAKVEGSTPYVCAHSAAAFNNRWTMSASKYAVIKMGGTTTPSDGKSLSISGANTPGNINEGNVFSVTGTISSGSPITSVTVGVYDMNGNFKTGVQNVNPNSSYYDIKASADAKVYFNYLAAGTYRYVVSAKNSAGASKEFVNKTFQVVGKVVNYTVTFDANGGSVSPSTKSVASGSTIGSLPTPTRTGYKFERWAEEPSGGFGVSEQKVITENRTIYAQWTPLSYTVSFDANGGKCSTGSITRSYGSALGSLPEATRTGYSFIGWYDGNERVSPDTEVVSGMTLVAKWDNNIILYSVEGGNIYFDKTNGTITNCDQSVRSANIPSAILGYTVTKIDSRAFDRCYNLVSVTIPDSVTSIGFSPFFDCSKLETITVASANPFYYSENGVLYRTIDTNKKGVLVKCPATKAGVFKIPDGVEYIDDKALDGCSKLTDVLIPGSIVEIANQAFRNCSSLTNLVIPEGVQSINQEVFFGCSSLKSLSLPSTLTYITFMPITGDSAFSGCSNLTEVNVSPDNRRYCSVDGVVYTKDKKGLLFYPTGLQGKYEIPAGVVYIGEYAFSGHSGITELVFSSEIQNIGRAAFRHADSLIYVFYKGSEADWKKVNNYGVNEALDSSIMHYNSTDHTFDPDTVIKKESCREAGIARLKCSVCGEVKYELIPATGHKWDTGKITKAATCAEEGARQYTCATCGETRTEPIPITDHHYSITQIISPSCKQEGYTMHICDVCGSSYGDTVIHATDHIWDSGKVTQQPTVSAEGIKIFTCTVCGETRTEAIPKLEPKPDDPPTPPTPGNPFADVASGEYFYDPVLWAVNHTPQITNGTSRTTFSPNATCTRGQVVTFLWRAMGEPEPTSAVNKFTDVQTSDYFYKAVLWAVEKGITVGTSDTTFSPNDPCTRAHVVTFLWRAEEQPSVAGANPFADVASGHYYYSAVLWAVSKNITQGTSASTFSPDNPCTRAQIVTFLYRDMK